MSRKITPLPRMKLFLAIGVVAVSCVIGLFLWRPWRGAPPTKEQSEIARFAKLRSGKATYTEASSFSTGMKQARALAVGAEGNIYVAGDNQVSVFGPGGKVVRTIDLQFAPQALALAANGDVCIADKRQVCLLDAPQYKVRKLAQLNAKANITSIALADDATYVADFGNRVVVRLDRDGKTVATIGKDDKRKVPGFVIPSAHFKVAVAPDGLLRVTDPGRRRIDAFTPDGDLEFFWGTASMNLDGFSGCCNPASFAVFPDGRIVTAEKGALAMVKIFEPDGQDGGGRLSELVAGPEELSELCKADDSAVAPDVAVDKEQRVIVLDTARNAVRIFAPLTATRSPGANR